MDTNQHERSRKGAVHTQDYGETFDVLFTTGGSFLVARKDNDDDGEGPTLKSYETVQKAQDAVDRWDVAREKANKRKINEKVIGVTIEIYGYGKQRKTTYRVEALTFHGINASTRRLMLKRGGRALTTKVDAVFRADQMDEAQEWERTHKEMRAANDAHEAAGYKAAKIPHCGWGRMAPEKKMAAEDEFLASLKED